MKALEAYQTYLAIKQHFSDGSYDYFKYNGKIRVNASSFHSRRDRFFYEKLARRFEGKPDDLRNFFVCNLSDNPKQWIRELIGVQAEEKYKQWKAKQESLSYNFQQDVSKIAEQNIKFDDLFHCADGQHPPLLSMYTNSEITIETLIGFDILLKCFRRWNKEIDDPIIWPDIYTFCQRYRPFLRIDNKRFKEILVKEFV